MALASALPLANLPLPAERFRRLPHPGPAAPSRRDRLEWRLRRVLDCIEVSLFEPISFPDLAAAAGLRRMHFAALFRTATGLRPPDLVVRRRVEWAQELLRDPALPPGNVALSVVFQAQVQFTTVWRALVMETPERWRKLQFN